MKDFRVSADVKNIYNNNENTISTLYRANNKKKALQGFIDYLKSKSDENYDDNY